MPLVDDMEAFTVSQLLLMHRATFHWQQDGGAGGGQAMRQPAVLNLKQEQLLPVLQGGMYTLSGQLYL